MMSISQWKSLKGWWALIAFALVITGFAVYFASEEHEWKLLTEGEDQQLITLFEWEGIPYKIQGKDALHVPSSKLQEARLMGTSLSRLNEHYRTEKSAEDIVTELVIERNLQQEIDKYLKGILGKENYLSEVHVTIEKLDFPHDMPEKFGVHSEKEEKASGDMVSLFLRSPGFKNVGIRLLINEEALAKRKLDEARLKKDIEKHIILFLANARGLKVEQTIRLIPFAEAGLNTYVKPSHNFSIMHMSILLAFGIIILTLILSWGVFIGYKISRHKNLFGLKR